MHHEAASREVSFSLTRVAEITCAPDGKELTAFASNGGELSDELSLKLDAA